MRPREQLAGEKLSGGWKVIRMLTKKSSTGSNFSVGYLVENDDGRQGFLKAMDYLEALMHPNALEMLKQFADIYLFEKQICEICRDRHFRRIVHAIDSGSIMPDPRNPASRVEYLIFELADGDVRAHLDARLPTDTAFMLRVLHNVATALQQLHGGEMAHQDTKPSNVLIGKEHAGAKLADLGRAWSKAFPSPFDGAPIAGDPSYAPPELLYRAVPADAEGRRFGCDLYYFGNLIAFVFTRVSVNSLLAEHLQMEHLPLRWGGSFAEVMPYLRSAFGAALAELEAHFPTAIREPVLEMVRQLCEPEPSLRGHPLKSSRAPKSIRS